MEVGREDNIHASGSLVKDIKVCWHAGWPTTEP
jgi:hypothetical protein